MASTKQETGYTMADVERLSGVRRRTLLAWARAGLLPRPTGRGMGARYDEAFVAKVRAIGELRRQGVWLKDVPARLAALRPPPPPMPTAPPPALALPSERWERLTILPGLELSFAAGASPLARRVAEMIWQHFGGRAGG